MKGYDLISRIFIVNGGKVDEVKVFKKQPFLWRFRWIIIAILFAAITAYKIYIGDFQF